jgi:hypothetical protein
MSHRGAAVLVGVNGLLALEAIDPSLVQGLLDKAITLEGSGELPLLLRAWLWLCRTAGRRRATTLACRNRRCCCAATKHRTDRYNMHTGEWLEYMPMSNDKFKERYG